MTYIYITWILIRWIDFTILHTPETAFQRTSEPNDAPIETPQQIRSYPFYRKLWWSISLVSNLRGIGWSWRVRNVSFVQSTTTIPSACLEHLLLVLKYALICDLRDYLATYTHLLNPQTTSSYFSLALPHQLLYVWMGIFNSAAGIALPYHLPALFVISLRLTTPQHWPAVFGPWSSAYTVRNAWGTLWHQYLRRWFEVFNNVLLNTFSIRRGTLTSKYVQIYFAFFLSALFHHAGALNVPYFPSVRYQFLFFLSQPVCITVEDIGIALGKRAGIRDSPMSRAAGYLWTFTAISFTGRYMAVVFTEYGTMLEPNPILFRFWERVMPLVGLPGAVGVSGVRELYL